MEPILIYRGGRGACVSCGEYFFEKVKLVMYVSFGKGWNKKWRESFFSLSRTEQNNA